MCGQRYFRRLGEPRPRPRTPRELARANPRQDLEIVAVEAGASGGGFAISLAQFNGSGGGGTSSYTYTASGALCSLKLVTHNPQAGILTTTEGVLEGETVRMTSSFGGGRPIERTKTWPPGVVPLPVALFVLPTLRQELPASGLVFSVVQGTKLMPKAFRLAPEAAAERPDCVRPPAEAVALRPVDGSSPPVLIWVSTAETARGEVLAVQSERRTAVAISAAEGKRLLARGKPHAYDVVGFLAEIRVAQVQFREEDRDHDGQRSYADSLEALRRANLFRRARPEGGVWQGYRVEVCRASATPDLHWLAVARPLESGGWHYAVNHEGAIYFSEEPFPLDREACQIAGGEPLLAR